MKLIQKDKGNEFQAELTKFLDDHGIYHWHTLTSESQQNGIVARKHETVWTRASLIAANVPEKFWDEAMDFTVHTLNQKTRKMLEK